MILFAIFTLSLTLNAVHGCEAFMRSMVPAVCVDPQFPAETFPCEVIGPTVWLTCEVRGNEVWLSRNPLPGEVLTFCIFAENSVDRSGCAEPVNRL